MSVGSVSARRWISAIRTAVLFIAGLICISPDSVEGQVVRGQVVDSISGQPLSGVSLALLNDENVEVARYMSDSAGLFLFRPDSMGAFRLNAQLPGYVSSTFPPFEVASDEIRTFLLLLPSLTTAQQYEDLVNQACSGGRNGGTVLGWVRDAETRMPVPEATVRVSWANVPSFLSEAVSVGEFSGEARADSAGLYAICGVPLGTKIWLHATVDSGKSDFTNLTFGDGTVSVGRETLAVDEPTWRQNLYVVPADQRGTSLRGVVTLNPGGVVVGDATVELMGTEYATQTDSMGVFELHGLPAGPTRVVVRRIGNEQIRQEIMLPGEGTLDLPPGVLVLGDAQVLAPLIVETTPGHNPLAEFNARRVVGSGNFLTREEFSKQGVPATPVDVLRRMPGVRILSGGDLDQRWIISMSRGGPRTFGFADNGAEDRDGAVNTDIIDVNPCPPLVFVDRHFIGNVNQIDVDGAIALETVDAVETHHSAASLPNEFSRPGSSCGVIAFWTRFAEPRAMEVSDRQRARRSLVETTGFHVFVAMSLVVAIFFGLGKSIHF